MTTEQKIQELKKQIEKLKKESQKEEMKEWFKSLLNGLEIRINDNNPNSVYYKKNGKFLFKLYQDSEKKYFYCDYYLVWDALQDKYNLNYYETQASIKSMVEQCLKLGVVTPEKIVFLKKI
jgi:hypothetical protein